MKTTPEEYNKAVSKKEKSPAKIKDFILSFCVGGLICTLGQLLGNLYKWGGLSEDKVKAAVPVTLIALSALFTGLGLYDKLARHAGAGTLVPITGFANAMVSPALEFKSEGQIMGIGAKMFVLAGPVLVFGVCSAAVYGLVLFVFKLV